MGRLLLARRVAHMAMAPAGAAAAITTTGFILGGEKTVCSLTNRIGALSLLPRAPLLLQSRGGGATKFFSTESKKSASTAAAEKVVSSPPATRGPLLLQWYEKHLQARPVPTKMVTGTILWGLGDAVAQIVPHLMAEQEEQNNKPFAYDWPRTGRACFFGFAIHAPASHVHFNFLEWLTVRTGISGLGIPVFKAFMEQFVYWSWISNSLYHGCMGAMQGQGFEEIYNRIADVLWETQKAQWVFWIPIQLLNFQFVPVRHQLNVVLLTSVVWTALLSAWYPPEEEEKQVKKIEEKPQVKKDEEVQASVTASS